MREPNFFIIGAPKCGTTSVYFWLSEHPEIYMSPVKEPNFFSGDICRKQKVESIEGYKKLFEAANPDHKVVGEASTTYMMSETAVPKIEKRYDTPKYLVLIRNPVSMAHSLYRHLVATGAEHIGNFEKAWNMSNMRREEKRVNSIPISPKMLDYKKACKLGEQIERLKKVVRNKRLKVINIEDIKENTQKEYKKIINFLGLKSYGRTKFDKKNQAKKRTSGTLHRMVRKVGNLSNRVKKRLGIPVYRGTGITKKIIKANTKKTKKPKLNKEMKREMKKYFEEDIKKLQKVTNINLSNWLS